MNLLGTFYRLLNSNHANKHRRQCAGIELKELEHEKTETCSAFSFSNLGTRRRVLEPVGRFPFLASPAQKQIQGPDNTNEEFRVKGF